MVEVRWLLKQDKYKFILADQMFITCVILNLISSSDIDIAWQRMYPLMPLWEINEMRLHYNKILQEGP